jgi:hypothetical protein
MEVSQEKCVSLVQHLSNANFITGQHYQALGSSAPSATPIEAPQQQQLQATLSSSCCKHRGRQP